VRVVVSPSVRARLSALDARFSLPEAAVEQLATVLDLVATEPAAITSVRDPAQAVDLHVADSLVAVDLAAVREAGRIADLGSGGGFPGLVLAIALPGTRVALVESVARKCAFLNRAVAAAGAHNAAVVNERVEAWRAGLGAHDVVTARALAPLAVLLEYAAPLLVVGGVLVAWKGRRQPAEETDAAAAARVLGMAPPAPCAVEPFPAARDRHLYVSRKVGSTPNAYPRRPGVARKRPLRASTGT
jgi:16S rRNA (guanine527-N7)-methyltransferase